MADKLSKPLKLNIYDIFPRFTSNSLEKLQYPKKFQSLASQDEIKIFLLYMNDEHKIYYKQRSMSNKYMDHIKHVGLASKKFEEFRPNDINWCAVATRFRKPTTDTHRQNIDTRIGFKVNDKYLVKAYFTFGQRSVKPGTAHVYQTLNVPLIFLLLEKKLTISKGLFPYQSMHLYDRRILMPNSCFRIPAGTTYLIFSTQKNYFSLKIVADTFKIPFNHRDPVIDKVTKIQNLYELPPATPYIEDLEEENLDSQQNESLTFQKPQETLQESNLEEFNDFPQEMYEILEQNSHNLQVFQQPQESNLQVFQQPQEIYAFFPSESYPIMERNVIVSSPDFVTSYQKIKFQTYDKPNLFVPDQNVNDPPLDLSCMNFDSIMELPSTSNQVDELIKELCMSPFSLNSIY